MLRLLALFEGISRTISRQPIVTVLEQRKTGIRVDIQIGHSGSFTRKCCKGVLQRTRKFLITFRF